MVDEDANRDGEPAIGARLARISLADVEAELQAAEAYLTAPVTSSARSGGGPSKSTLETSTSSPRTSRIRPSLTDERRREILAKLSAERQAAVRRVHRKEETACSSTEDPLATTIPINWRQQENDFGSPPTFRNRSDRNFRSLDAEPTREGDEAESQRPSEADEGAHVGEDDDVDDDDTGELFYASDIMGIQSVHGDVIPRNRIDVLVQDAPRLYHHQRQESMSGFESYTENEPAKTVSQQSMHVSSPHSSLFEKVLARRHELEASLASLPTVVDSTTEAHSPRAIDQSMVHGRDMIERDVVPVKSQGERDSGLHSALDEDHLTLRQSSHAVKTTSRLADLAQPRTREFVEREKRRLALEMETLRECTFRPQLHDTKLQNARVEPAMRKVVRFAFDDGRIGDRISWLTLSPRHGTSSPKGINRSKQLIDRLHLDITARYQERERLREELEAQRFRECTFAPAINPVSRRIAELNDYTPIHERIAELQRNKSETIQRMRQEIAMEHSGHSFVPSINPRSREIARTVLETRHKERRIPSHTHQGQDASGAEILPVTERLVEDARTLAEKRLAVQEYYDALQQQPYTPKINGSSLELLKRRPEFRLDFVSRQEYYQLVDQERREALEDQLRENELTFQPDIGNAREILRELRPDRVHESQPERLYRLIYDDTRRKELKRQQLREEGFAKYPFKPQINSVSRALAECAKHNRDSNRKELKEYFSAKRFRSRVAKEMDQAQKAECTFRPTLIARSKTSVKPKSHSTSKLLVKERQLGGYSSWQSDEILQQIEFRRAKRAQKLIAKKNEQELKELQECTFQPQLRPKRHNSDPGRTVRASSPSTEPVIVRGLGRFLEHRDRARQLAEEKQKREERAFNPNHAYRPRSYTIPKPFKLSEASKDSIRRRLKVREEMRARERKECTFVPETIEAKHRKVLQNLLDG